MATIVEPDQCVGHTETSGDAHRPAHQQFGPEDDNDDPTQRHRDVPSDAPAAGLLRRCRLSGGQSIGVGILVLGDELPTLPPRHANQHHCVNDRAAHHYDAVQSRQHAVCGQRPQQQRRRRHHWQIEAQCARLDRKRQDQRAEAEDEHQVDDVGARDVADGQLAAAFGGGRYADGELGQAGTDRHHRKADQNRTDPPPRRNLGGAPNHDLCPGREGDQPPTNQRAFTVMAGLAPAGPIAEPRR